MSRVHQQAVVRQAYTLKSTNRISTFSVDTRVVFTFVDVLTVRRKGVELVARINTCVNTSNYFLISAVLLSHQMLASLVKRFIYDHCIIIYKIKLLNYIKVTI